MHRFLLLPYKSRTHHFSLRKNQRNFTGGGGYPGDKTEDAHPWKIIPDEDPHWQFLEGTKKKTIFFFCKLKFLSEQSKGRVVRVSGCGTWDGKAITHRIKNSEGRVIAQKRLFSFKPRNGFEEKMKGRWIMHEYSLIGSFDDLDYVLCRITVDPSKNCCFSDNNSVDGLSSPNSPVVMVNSSLALPLPPVLRVPVFQEMAQRRLNDFVTSESPAVYLKNRVANVQESGNGVVFHRMVQPLRIYYGAGDNRNMVGNSTQPLLRLNDRVTSESPAVYLKNRVPNVQEGENRPVFQETAQPVKNRNMVVLGSDSTQPLPRLNNRVTSESPAVYMKNTVANVQESGKSVVFQRTAQPLKSYYGAVNNRNLVENSTQPLRSLNDRVTSESPAVYLKNRVPNVQEDRNRQVFQGTAQPLRSYYAAVNNRNMVALGSNSKQPLPRLNDRVTSESSTGYLKIRSLSVQEGGNRPVFKETKQLLLGYGCSVKNQSSNYDLVAAANSRMRDEIGKEVVPFLSGSQNSKKPLPRLNDRATSESPTGYLKIKVPMVQEGGNQPVLEETELPLRGSVKNQSSNDLVVANSKLKEEIGKEVIVYSTRLQNSPIHDDKPNLKRKRNDDIDDSIIDLNRI